MFGISAINQGGKMEEGLFSTDTTSQAAEQLHFCKVCHLPYARKATLRQHELTHIKPEPEPEFPDEDIDAMIEKACKGDVNKMKPRVLIEKLKPAHDESEKTGGKPFPCDFCSKGFNQKQTLMFHLRSKHKNKLRFKCSICKLRFSNTNSLQIHIKRHVEKDYFACKECDSSFDRWADLNHHMMIHTGKKLFRCNLCEKSFGSNHHLQTHLRQHNAYFHCLECDERFYTKEESRLHAVKHMEKLVKRKVAKRLPVMGKYRCKKCPRVFKYPNGLKRHIQWEHSFDPEKALENELTAVAAAPPQEAEKLPYILCSNGKADTLISCNQCGKAFDNEALLNIHKIIHIGQQSTNIVIKPEIMVKEEEIKQEAEDYVEEFDDNHFVVTPPVAAQQIKQEPSEQSIASNDLNDNYEDNGENGENYSSAASLLVKTEIKQEMEDSD
eukprot:TRINITY_DN3708_c0_g1_i5.p1 TRINITY_DN3708_c0_g1~~TRINITY_DN3708_c0_g1_i5.p1  ORF type:complete len:440 (+),score=86.62 TRINITY_DN3708_c0_g1_i5:166-1485(+)